MKNLLDKINILEGNFNALMLESFQHVQPGKLDELRNLFSEIRNDAQSFCKKQTSALAHFDSLINLLSEIVFEVDLSGRIIFMNDYGIEKLEINKEYFENGRINIADVIHPDDVEKARASIFSNSTGKRTSGNEYRLIAGSGNIILVQIFNSPIFNNNSPVGLRGIAIDITQRKKAENDLRDSVEKYRGIFNNSPLAIGYYTKEGILTDCNEKFALMLGNTKEALMGFNIFRDLKNKGMLRALKKSLVSGTGSYEGVYRAVLTQKENPTRVLFQGISDEQGNIYGGVALAEDISERIEAENALKTSEEKFRNLVENIGEGAGITDNDNNFLFSNRAADVIFGVENEGLMNRSLKDFILPGKYDQIHAETNKRKLGLKSTYEIEILRPDGQTRDLLVTATPNYDENKMYASTLGIFRDITERKKIEEELRKAHKTLLKKNRELNIAIKKAEESDRLKSAFLASMNHELRTPLNGIIGLSELMDGSMAPGEIEDFSKQIYQSGMNLLTLIDDIFQTVQLEMGETSPELSQFNVAGFLTDVKMNAQRHLADTGKNQIIITIDVPPENTDLNLITDKSLLKKVFENLIHNAIKFTPEGEIKFGVIQSDHQEATFYVSDTGIGIPAENHQLIFERFRQIDQRHKRKYGGSGLGLYYSKKIIELINGKIWVESIQNRGTTFFFSIPSSNISLKHG